MSSEDTGRVPKLRGAEDLAWVVFVFLCSALMVWLLVEHLRLGRESLQLANQQALEAAESRRLQQEETQLLIERAVRSRDMDLEGIATELGFRQPRPDQIVELEVPR